jgi:hypothetical protein
MIRSMTFSGLVLFGLTASAVGQTIPAGVEPRQAALSRQTAELNKRIPELLKQCVKCSDQDKAQLVAALKHAVDAVETVKKETSRGFAEVAKTCKKK